MTREDIKKANEIIQNIEKLERIKENINKSHAITFNVSPTIGENIRISDNIDKKELKSYAILQIQTKIDKCNDKLKQLWLD